MASGFARACVQQCDSPSASSDSQFTETEEELTFLEACAECDDEALYDIVHNGTTFEQVNEVDKSGRVSTSASDDVILCTLTHLKQGDACVQRLRE